MRLARLQEIGPSPLKGRRQVLAMERLVQRYGGVFHKKPRRTWILVRAIFSGLVTPWEISRLIHANYVSLEAMNTELLGLDLSRSVSAVGVPVLFFLGRYDQLANAKLAAAYFENLHAPVKRVQWFEKSAQNIPFEEPRLFNATVVRELQSVGIGTGHLGGWLPTAACWKSARLKREATVSNFLNWGPAHPVVWLPEVNPISQPRSAPFFHRKKAFGVVPNAREFLAEHYV